MHQPLEVKNYDGYDNRNSNDDDFDINIIHGGSPLIKELSMNHQCMYGTELENS